MERWEIYPDSSLLPLLEQAGNQPIDITHNGAVVGQIILKPGHDRNAAQVAMKELLAMPGLKLAPGETIKDLINEGREW